MKHTRQQIAVAKSALKQDTFCEADAGTGKTTAVELVVKAYAKYAPQKNIIYFCFGRKNVNEALAKFKGMKNVVCHTFHSFAFFCAKKLNKKLKIKKNYKELERERLVAMKVFDKADELIEFIQMCKRKFARKEADFQKVAELYYPDSPNIKNYIAKAIQYFDLYMKQAPKWDKLDSITYDDIIYRAAIGQIPVAKYHLCIIDEAQDANESQWVIAYRTTHNIVNGKAKKIGLQLSVGDFKQSIYGFQGAFPAAMEAANKDAVKFPLTLSFRCPKEVVEKIRKEIPRAKSMEYVPAHTGCLVRENASYTEIKQRPSTMILCRNNQPLFALYAYLHKKGLKVRLEQSHGLFAEINRLIKKDTNLVQLVSDLKAKIRYSKNEALYILSDQLEGVKTLEDLRKNIASLEKGHNDPDAITLCTCHAAKGLEANHIYVYRPELLEGNRAKNKFEKEQEENLYYVTLSRVKWSASGCSLNMITDSIKKALE